MANLFQKAKTNGTEKPVKASNKTEVVVKDSVLEANIKRLAQINTEMDSLKAEQGDLTSQVKSRAIEEFTSLYNREKKYLGSFNLVAGTSSLMVIPTDKYLTIDEEKFNYLKKEYGAEMVEEKDTYILDTEMVEKYGDIISKLIEKCKDIPDEDKAKLIKVETKRSVRKGTIQVIFEKFKKFTGNKLSGLVSDIQPVFQLKNVKG